MDRITIYQFTDPVCIWSWGNEPAMRAIDYLYGNKVEIKYIMGGLVEDIVTLFDLRGSRQEIIEQANCTIAANWLTASQRHGMPVNCKDMSLYSERYPSSFPQNIAYKAAKRLNPDAAKHFLRRIREATFIESKRTSQIDVLIRLAVECGFNAAKFIDEYTTGEAQNDFMQDRITCRRNGISGFPSYLIRRENTNIILGGYQNLSTFHTIINRLSAGKIKPRKIGPSIAGICDFVKRYTSVYPIEIGTTFGLDRQQTDLMIQQLIKEHHITTIPAGNGIKIHANKPHERAKQHAATKIPYAGREKNNTKTEIKTPAEAKEKVKV